MHLAITPCHSLSPCGDGQCPWPAILHPAKALMRKNRLTPVFTGHTLTCQKVSLPLLIKYHLYDQGKHLSQFKYAVNDNYVYGHWGCANTIRNTKGTNTVHFQRKLHCSVMFCLPFHCRLFSKERIHVCSPCEKFFPLRVVPFIRGSRYPGNHFLF